MDEAERLRKLSQVQWRQRKLDRTPKDSKDFDWIEWYDLQEEAADLFSKSIEIDNNFGQAYSYLAFTISHFVFLGFSKKPEDDIKNAKFYVEKALDCDNRDSLAHEMLARIYSLSKNHDQAVEAAKKAIECNVKKIAEATPKKNIFFIFL